jgi:RND family efflux transporter MFP subunit
MTRSWLLPFLAAAVAGCDTPDAVTESTREPIAVTVEAAALHPLLEGFDAGGVVAARTTAIVASRIVATVTAVAVSPGDRVRAGQRLVVLDSRDLDAQRRQAAASAVALERTAAATAAARAEADAALVLARVTHDRIAALHAKRAATSQELDGAVSALRAAEARVLAAGAREGEVAASVESARAAGDAASVAASFAIVTAPFDGVVTEKLTEPGNLATPGMPLLRVEDTRAYRLEVRLDESRTAGMAAGDAAAVRVGGGVELAGRVSEIARAADAATHAVLVKIDLPVHPLLRSGMFGRARFTAGTRQALAVPAAAIVPQGQLATVFVVSPAGRARMRVIRTGASSAGRTEVLAGLAAGEQVIVSPPAALRDGDRVR